jgi:predicted DCC family thiol-disulfide oxidoreductase YuxK
MIKSLDWIMRYKGIILFDGYCNFCSRSVMFIIRRDRHAYFTFAPSQTPEGQKIIQKYRLGELAQHSIVLIDQENVYMKSSAALRIARRLSGAWSLFYLGMIIPGRIRDWMYEGIARNRYRLFGKRDRCFLPDPESRDRFLGEK